MDYAISASVDDIVESSSSMVRGAVQAVRFVPFGGNAFTQVDVLVSESYQGKLQEGDLTTVWQLGGYISLRDHIDFWDDAFRFEGMSQSQIDNTVFHEVVEDEPSPKISDENIYFLNTANPQNERPANSFERTRETASLFRIEQNNQVSRINVDALATRARSISGTYGNEVMLLDALLEAAQ